MFEIKMPKMGESIEQATITKWFVKEGDLVEEDDVLLEIATDKVDSEIPSPVSGKIEKILFKQNEIVPVGIVIAIIDTGSNGLKKDQSEMRFLTDLSSVSQNYSDENTIENRFYSPLVKSIAQQEKISLKELESINGTGKGGRVKKEDILKYLETRPIKEESPKIFENKDIDTAKHKVNMSVSAVDEIIQMDRMRRLIADHMIMSKQVSPHVTNMVEADVSNLVKWRELMKEIYLSKHKVKLTFMPIFTEAVARAIRDFPLINSSVDGERIIVKGNINIGIAVAKSDGNLIVPVVRNADKLNIPGIANAINSLAENARSNKLSPDDIKEGTFTITNFGTFKNVMGTPIISQPQVAILATGTIEKKPAVVETEYGDIIVPRHKMFLSLSYDHRIIDGALGGAFLRRVADYLEQFDVTREV
jgi:2-oxoglutarate dehydrogenase E2 component (dihydrolipoamide succinyltransferase)